MVRASNTLCACSSVIVIPVNFSSAAVFASAEEGAPRVYAADCTATQGGYAYVDIKAENFSAVGSMEVYVYYDTSVFAYNSSSANGLNAGNLCDVADDKENGVVLLQSLSPGGMNGSGNLWRITFSVAQDAPAGQYTLGVAVGEVISSALKPLEVGAGNGKITVTERPAAVNTMYVYSSVGNAVYEGEQTEVKFYTNNAYGLAAADFEIEYNSSRLKLGSVSLGNSLMQAEGAIWSVNTDTAGYIKISYINLKGISGSVNPLITCSFTVVGNVQESVPVSLTVSGIYDGAQNAIKSDGATADVSTLYVPPVVTYPAVYISEYTGTDGRFEVQVIAEGATALAAGDFVITYDNTALECVSVEKSVAENIVSAVRRRIEYGGKIPFILSALYQHLAVRFRLYGHGNAFAHMQAVRALFYEAVPLSSFLLSVPAEGDVSLYQKNRHLLLRKAEASFLSGLHAVNGDVHHHIVRAFSLSRTAQYLYAIFIKFRITE